MELNPIVMERGCFTLHFRFFEFLKNGCKYQIQIWHACKTNKMPTDQYWNKDINAELDFEISNKLFLVPITTKGGSIHLRQSFDIWLRREDFPFTSTPYSD